MRSTGSKVLALVLTMSGFLTFASAQQVPDLKVEPVNRSDRLVAGQEHTLVWTFRNPSTNFSVENVSLEDSENLKWQSDNFDVAENSSRQVEAVYNRERKGMEELYFVPEYFYEGSDNSFDGPNISVEVTSFYRDTSVEIRAFRESFEKGFDETAEDALLVRNRGDYPAFGVSLAGSGNVSLNPGQSFVLEPNESRVLDYNVTIPEPSVNKTSATNETYVEDVTVFGENFGNSSFSAEVFVPFREYDRVERSRDIIEVLKRLQESQNRLFEQCSRPEFQNLTVCEGDIVEYRNRTKVVNRTPEANVTLTESEISDLRKLSNVTTQEIEDLRERVQLLQDTVRSEEEITRSELVEELNEIREQVKAARSMNRRVNRTVEASLERDRSEDRWIVWLSGLGLFLVVGFLVFRGGRYVYREIRERQNDIRI